MDIVKIDIPHDGPDERNFSCVVFENIYTYRRKKMKKSGVPRTGVLDIGQPGSVWRGKSQIARRTLFRHPPLLMNATGYRVAPRKHGTTDYGELISMFPPPPTKVLGIVSRPVDGNRVYCRNSRRLLDTWRP